MTDAGAVFRFLCDNRFRPDDIPDRPEPGVCAIFPFAGDSRILEKRLIKENEPPLNLTDWRNPQKAQIQALREVCKEEAKRVWERYHISLP